MREFLATVLTFPTLPWSVLFTCATLYWLLVAIGVMDAEFGADLPADGGEVAAASGMLARLGLSGVPLMLLLALASFWGWITSYFVQLYLLPLLPAALLWPGKIATAVLAIVPAVFVSSLMLRPLRLWLARLRPANRAPLPGRVGTVISPHVDADNGQAEFDDGGAGLIFQVRARPPETFRRGDRVVLLEYRASDHTWRVTAESRLHPDRSGG